MATAVVNIVMGSSSVWASANRSGQPAALTACEVEEQLAGAIALILDGGTMPSLEVSTVLDVGVEPAQLQRVGMITPATIATVLGYPLAEPTGKPG